MLISYIWTNLKFSTTFSHSYSVMGNFTHLTFCMKVILLGQNSSYSERGGKLMEWFDLFTRTVIMYIFVFIVMRLMGKREIGKLSIIDLVISFMIAEIAVLEIEQMDGNLMHGLIPMATLLLIQVGTAAISMRSRKLRIFMDGRPKIIIANGKIDADQLRKQRYTLDDLMLQLRENGHSNLNEVDFAILETSGKLSIIAKENDTSSEVNDNKNNQAIKQNENTGNKKYERKIPQEVKKIIPPGFRYETLPIPLIMDGNVQDNNLNAIKQTRFWLKNIIQEHGAQHFKEVLLCTIDHKNRIYIDLDDRTKT